MTRDNPMLCMQRAFWGDRAKPVTVEPIAVPKNVDVVVIITTTVSIIGMGVALTMVGLLGVPLA